MLLKRSILTAHSHEAGKVVVAFEDVTVQMFST